MAVHFHDSADLKGSLLLHVLTESFDIATIHIGRIPDIGNTATEYAATPCTVLYLYRLLHHHSPVDNFFDCHLLKRYRFAVWRWNHRRNRKAVQTFGRIVLSVDL